MANKLGQRWRPTRTQTGCALPAVPRRPAIREGTNAVNESAGRPDEAHVLTRLRDKAPLAVRAGTRVWVKINASETVCDGVDNDNDGTVDDGLSGCSEDHDHKRLAVGSLYQGDGASAVNLVDGNLIVRQVDAVVQGPFGPLVLSRTYDSRRDTSDAAVGDGWTHSFAVYLKQMVSGDDRWRVQTASGEMQYFRCTSYASSMACVIDDHHVRGNLRRSGGRFYYLRMSNTSQGRNPGLATREDRPGRPAGRGPRRQDRRGLRRGGIWGCRFSRLRPVPASLC